MKAEVKMYVLLLRLRRRLLPKGKNVKLMKGAYYLTDSRNGEVKGPLDMDKFLRENDALQPYEVIKDEQVRSY